MSDMKLMFVKHGRILLPLLAGFILVCVGQVILCDNIQAQSVVGIVSMLLVVGATVYCLDYPLRFYALGEDRLFHLSPASRLMTTFRSSLVLVVYLMCFFVVGQAARLIASRAKSGPWVESLLGGSARKLASLVCAFCLMAAVSAVIKPLRGRTVSRAVGWAIFCVVEAVLAGALIAWLTRPTRAIQWAIGVVDGTMSSVYAGVLPILVPTSADLATVGWLWALIDLAVAAVSAAIFMGVSHLGRVNFLTA